MQRLIGHINDRLTASRELDKDTYYLEGVLSIAEELLEVEKEQIMDARGKTRKDKTWLILPLLAFSVNADGTKEVSFGWLTKTYWVKF